ncbi:PhoX family protein [Hydrogenophaga sp. T2]|uniref:PhoX family protein n=1 Tax=Hydrogenophaga sp. T2 TaxID=3132823 RepID=UPI003CEF9E73
MIDFNDEDSNRSPNPTFDSVLNARLSRRHLLRGGAGAAVAGGAALSGCASTGQATAPAGPVSQLGFKPVAHSLADTVVVPPGYTAQVLYAGGDPLAAGVPAFKNDGTDNEWGRRAGDHHDGIEWFGLDAEGKPSATFSSRGVLAMNHEATTDEKLSSFFIHANGGTSTLPRPAAEIDKELMIHGISVVEVRRDGRRWVTRQDSPLNRRITTLSEAVFTGPAAGSAHLVTRFSPGGTKARGTVNNCGTGRTPWGTLVSGEENWFGYFFRDAQDDARRNDPKMVNAFNRYGRRAGAPSRHGWESGGSEDRFQRWNTGVTGASAREDYRNEFHTFGYVVELDPYNPNTLLTKRTALGRFAHENVSFAVPVAGQPVVAYMGCDARGEYIYKFVSSEKWDPADAQPRNRLAAGDKYLDSGTLYVARFNADGTGEWLELSPKNPAIAAHKGFDFKTQADVCVFTRLAADAAGATKMDRPEWTGVNPKNGEVYITLTNNSQRTPATVDAANPRAYTDLKAGKEQKGNVHGHIVRLAEATPADAKFRWDIYLFASEADADQATVNLSSLTADNDLSSPDGLVFSKATGICWIETDDGAYTDKTNCMLLAALPGQVGDGRRVTLKADGREVSTPAGKPQTPATLRRFLVGPRGAEITGITETPDGRALFVNIQHAGENTKMADIGDPAKYESQWPSNAGYGAGQRPRSATIVITKNDGGVIGS